MELIYSIIFGCIAIILVISMSIAVARSLSIKAKYEVFLLSIISPFIAVVLVGVSRGIAENMMLLGFASLLLPVIVAAAWSSPNSKKEDCEYGPWF